MNGRTERSEQILNVAERMARIGGYMGFSFREIAKQVGIKAASVHYHYPGKEDLGVAVARRYTDRFLDSLGPSDAPDHPPNTLLARYVAAYRGSLVDDGLMCLCGMLGAEIAALPPSVAAEARRFFDLNTAWLTRVFQRAGKRKPQARVAALKMIATLEGALLLARSMDDFTVFDTVSKGLASTD